MRVKAVIIVFLVALFIYVCLVLVLPKALPSPLVTGLVNFLGAAPSDQLVQNTTFTWTRVEKDKTITFTGRRVGGPETPDRCVVVVPGGAFVSCNVNTAVVGRLVSEMDVFDTIYIIKYTTRFSSLYKQTLKGIRAALEAIPTANSYAVVAHSAGCHYLANAILDGAGLPAGTKLFMVEGFYRGPPSIMSAYVTGESNNSIKNAFTKSRYNNVKRIRELVPGPIYFVVGSATAKLFKTQTNTYASENGADVHIIEGADHFSFFRVERTKNPIFEFIGTKMVQSV